MMSVPALPVSTGTPGASRYTWIVVAQLSIIKERTMKTVAAQMWMTVIEVILGMVVGNLIVQELSKQAAPLLATLRNLAQ